MKPLEMRGRCDERISHRVADAHGGITGNEGELNQPGPWTARESYQRLFIASHRVLPDEGSQRTVEQSWRMKAVIAERVDEAMLDQGAREGRERFPQPGGEHLLSAMPPATVLGLRVQIQRHQLAAWISSLLKEVRQNRERLQPPGRHQRVFQLAPVTV
ncbi:hypothetical protein MFUL124B02_29680 [Myxococcus fulvus 124B02]|nr:hypothetical protein MFUL124B02_29680 [Myxococcus fulvus 124B02]